MHPLLVNPRWFQDYWYGERPVPRRRSLRGSLARFAICILVVVGGAAVLLERSGVHDASAQPDHARLRFM